MNTRVKKRIVFLLSAVALLPITVCADTVHLTADNDTYIDALYADTSFGSEWKLLMSGSPGKPAHGLMHFDFSPVPEHALITKADLTLCVHGSRSTDTFTTLPLTRPWSETTATWRQKSAGAAWYTPGGDYDPATSADAPVPATIPGWTVMDVTGSVVTPDGAVDPIVAANGLLLQADDGYSKVLSSELVTYASAQTCHSCHGTFDTQRDAGKHTDCARCHSREGLPLAGEPALVVEYEPMLFQFVQLSDVHIGRTPQQSVNLTNAVTQINALDPDFVLFTGDLTEQGLESEYQTFIDTVALLSMPYYCIPGDNDVVESAVLGADLERYRAYLGDEYYRFEYMGFNIIGINNTLDPSLGSVQRQWFEQQLQGGAPNLVFGHKALLGRTSGMPVQGAEQVLDLLGAYGAGAFFNGDDHEHAQHMHTNVQHFWCDNLSFAHYGDPYNFYRVYSDRIVLYHVDLRNGSMTRVGSYALQEPLTLIELESFQAVAGNGRVTLSWSTKAEIDTAGFHVVRTEKGKSPVRITPELIAARGGALAGADYTVCDSDVQNRREYTYRLVDVDVTGVETSHGPVTATPRLLYGFGN